MALFEKINLEEINPDKPIVGLGGFAEKVKNSLDFLNGLLSSTIASGLTNGSFEVASDEANPGVPDSWTLALYAGGSGGQDLVSPQHGAACFKFTHPGGVGNGGGFLTSNYIECSPLSPIFLELAHWASNPAVHNLVQLLWYDAAKLYIGTATAYDTTVNSATPGLFLVGGTPPATARFVKIVLIGGLTDVNAAGSVYFDAATLAPVFVGRRRAAIQDFTLAEVDSATNDAWVNVGTAKTVLLPIAGLLQTLSFTAAGRGSVFWEDAETGTSGYHSSYARFVINGLYTTNQVFLPDAASNQTLSGFSVELPESVVGPILVQAQLLKNGSAAAYLEKTTQDLTCRANY